jgi:3-oxoacyl-[acyl-carrier protein] reductase
MDLMLKGKTAVVTGASQGIGRAIARELALEGVEVLAVGRNNTLLQSLYNDVAAAGGTVPALLAQDFVAADGPEKIAATARAVLGQVDILVNNAGRSRPVDVIGTEAEWEEGLTLDFIRHRQLTQALLPQFMERRQGVILNVVSTFELRSINVSAVAKASVVAWSKQLASQLGAYGIRVNCLQPGLISTENIRPYFPVEEREAFAQREIPLRHFGEPQDMADMATFLVSPRARYVTGTVAVVDGGMRHYAF